MFKVGDIITENIVVTSEAVELFAKCTGDFNPIHLDESYAKKTRFGRRIAHGMLSAGYISRVLAMKIGPGGVYLSQSLKFLKPVFIGDELTVTIKILAIRPKRGISTMETLITNQSKEVVVKGEAVIMMAEGL